MAKTKEIKTKEVETKNVGGRPTDYNNAIVAKTKKYIDGCIDEEYRLIKTDGAQSTSYDNKIKVKLPTIEGLALYLGMSRETIYQWEKEYEEFSDIIGKLRAKQCSMLIDKGLSGDYNPTIAKVLLSKHGYKEVTDITSNDQKIEPIVIYMPEEYKSAQDIEKKFN